MWRLGEQQGKRAEENNQRGEQQSKLLAANLLPRAIYGARLAPPNQQRLQPVNGVVIGGERARLN